MGEPRYRIVPINSGQDGVRLHWDGKTRDFRDEASLDIFLAQLESVPLFEAPLPMTDEQAHAAREEGDQ